jgi:hypothetical protein
MAAAVDIQAPTLTFVTGNKKKLEVRSSSSLPAIWDVAVVEVSKVPPHLVCFLQEVQRILKEAEVPFNITNMSLDLPELQGEPEEVAIEKCRLAAKEVRFADNSWLATSQPQQQQHR